MNNEDYLKQISAKPLKAAAASQNKFLSPFMIKLIACGLIAIVLLIVVMNLLGQSGARAKALTETIYTRMSLLSRNGGPIDSYGKQLYSSDLRALSSTLKTNLVNSARDLEILMPDISLNPNQVSKTVTANEEAYLTEYTSMLENARLNALLDRTYSSTTTLVISQLLTEINELLARNENRALEDLLQRTRTNFEQLRIHFQEFTDSH
jgi:hypothetical protein